jgi:hypothetical protein
LLHRENSALLERKDHLPILLHVDHGPPASGSSVQHDVRGSRRLFRSLEARNSRRLCKFGKFISLGAHIGAVSA